MTSHRSSELVLQRRPFGSWLLGGADQSPRMLRVRVQTLLTFFLIVTNVIGAVVVFVLAVWVLPGPAGTDALGSVRWIAFPVYFGLALAVGALWGTRLALRVTDWVLQGRPATRKEQIRTLRLPFRLTLMQFFLWLLATVIFTVLTIVLEPESLLRVTVTTLVGGLVTCAASYLLTEFTLRPIAARALTDQAPPRRLLAAGLKSRTVFFWAAGSAAPVLGLMLAAIVSLVERDVSVTRLAVVILVLGGIVLVVGWLLTLLSARSVVAPVRSVRTALTLIGDGDLTVRIPVFDGTELGSLQSGFNRMAAGLRERDRIRDLFGRYVGTDVVREVLTGDALGGEERFAAMLFVDLAGSTQLAAARPPTEVVRLLNRFFTVVVDEVDRNGGFVNKFAGDAVLAVFGAPADLPDPAAAALRTGRALATRLAAELPEITAGTGVTAGVVVAGTVGDVRRHEYTVVGDPVNEAARLSDLAKTTPGHLVASMPAVDHAARREARHWTPGEEITLRGRPVPTRLALPSPTQPQDDVTPTA